MLFNQLQQIGLRPGMTKMNDSLWNKLKEMNREEKMTNEELRYGCILYYKARYDRMIHIGKPDRANLYKKLTNKLLGLYANQEVINTNIGLSLEYIPKPGARFNITSRIQAGTYNELGQQYLPSTKGGKGWWVEPSVYTRRRPLEFLLNAWNVATRDIEQSREDLIHTQLCDDVIKKVEKRFDIIFPYEIRSRLSTNSFINKPRKNE